MIHCKQRKGHHTEGQGHFPCTQEVFRPIRLKRWKLGDAEFCLNIRVSSSIKAL